MFKDVEDTTNLVKKWEPILENEKFPKILDRQRKNITARVLENTLDDMQSNVEEWKLSPSFKQGVVMSEAVNSDGGGGVSNYDPIMISLIRRTVPNLIAYDIAGVQAMTGPTGIIFAFRPRYGSQTGPESWYNEVNTGYSTVTSGNTAIPGQAPGNLGTVPATGNTASYNYAMGMPTAQLEALGSTGNTAFNEMSFSIEKMTITAGGRGLKATYTTELAQDLRRIHGLDAETELANMLAVELVSEINRELLRAINVSAVAGAAYTQVPGMFDLDIDSNGRWFGEKTKGLIYAINRECNAIAKATRRGRGNILICSSDVASALDMAGVVTYTPALESGRLEVDDTGNTFVGVMNGRIKVYIDPYAVGDYFTVGFKGTEMGDAGIFYAPYTPLQMMRAVSTGGQDEFQPRIGFKTRYAIAANPFSGGATASNGSIQSQTNVFYRQIGVKNLL